MVDIVIPVLNEEKILQEKKDYYNQLKKKARIIFVDGGSSDHTVEVAKHYGKVICGFSPRSYQKNRGASLTQSPYILFLHVDCYVSDDLLKNAESALENGAIAGCFSMRIEGTALIFRIYEKIVNFRARYFGVVDGDLGLFVKKDVFDEVEGFDPLPVMEDLEIGRKLKRIGKIQTIPDIIKVSSRKWHTQGFLKTFLQYTFAYIQLWTRIPFYKAKNVEC